MEEKIEFYRETEFKDTEIGRIPKEWEVKKLGEFLHLKNGKRPDIVANGKFPVYGANGIMGYTDAYIVDDDIVIIGRVGAAGEVHLAKGKILVSDNVIYGINKNKTKIYLEFIYYVLKYANLSRFAPKTTHPIITQTLLENFKVPIPLPEEQQKIAEILSNIDEAIQRTDDIIAKTERLKKGLMQELLTKGIGHKEFKDTEIGKIPKDWEVKKLGEFLYLKNGKRPNIVAGGRFPVYGANGIMGYTDTYIVEDDVVIIGRVGAAGEVHLARGKVSVSDNVIYGINKNKTKIYLEFIYYVLKYANLSRFASKTTHPIITQTLLEDFKVPIPPLEKQQKIAEIISAVDEKLENLRRQKTKLERIKQWFMEELLSGRIRVRVA